MDMDIEVEEFKKKHAPSLIGSSVRDSSDAIPTLSSISNTSNTPFKEDSLESTVSVDDLIKEGSLIADEYTEQLNDILDQEGHVKKEHIKDEAEAELEAAAADVPKVNASELKELNLDEDKIDDANKVTILGGAADDYLAPASGNASGYKYSLKQKDGSDLQEFVHDSGNIIEPDKMRSVNDIINVVSKGDSEKASTLIDDDVAKSIIPDKKDLPLNIVKEHEEPVIPDSTIENDSEYTAPAAMREGSESRLLEEQRSRSHSKYTKSSSQTSFPERPNLARGDSIHSGLHDGLSISNTYDKTSHSLVSERKPRHDPSLTSASTVNSKISNSSSLNYLRSISRSRSRMANDRKALGEDHLDSKSLRESGALINDDAMSNRSDIEYAVTKALDYVEDTHSVKNGKRLSDSGDIVKNLQKGLAEVAEEEETDKQKALNSSDLLDQLANSAMELMIDSDNEENDAPATSFDSNNDEKERELEIESKPSETETNQEIEKSEPDVETEADKVEKITNISEDKYNEEVEDKECVTEATEEGKTIEPVTAKTPSLQANDDENKSVVDTTELKNLENEEVKSESSGNEEIDEKIDTTKEKVEKPTSDESTGKNIEANTTIKNEEEPVAKETTKSLETVSEKESSGGKFSLKEDNASVEPVINTSEQIPEISDVTSTSNYVVPKKDDNIDAIIAAAAREKAMNETYDAPGKDGSVFVPKNDKMTFENEPVYLYTSFAGGFQISTRTNRLVTILTANRIKFEYRDLGTDEEAKKVWRRYSAGKTLPGIVRGKDDYIGNWQDMEEANEEYQVRTLIYETY